MKVVTVRELSQKIGLGKSALGTFLCRFGKYAVNNGSEWYYKYALSKDFLLELKQFFCKKMYDHKAQHFTRYYKVVENIKRLIEEIDGEI